MICFILYIKQTTGFVDGGFNLIEVLKILGYGCVFKDRTFLKKVVLSNHPHEEIINQYPKH